MREETVGVGVVGGGNKNESRGVKCPPIKTKVGWVHRAWEKKCNTNG